MELTGILPILICAIAAVLVLFVVRPSLLSVGSLAGTRSRTVAPRPRPYSVACPERWSAGTTGSLQPVEPQAPSLPQRPVNPLMVGTERPFSQPRP